MYIIILYFVDYADTHTYTQNKVAIDGFNKALITLRAITCCPNETIRLQWELQMDVWLRESGFILAYQNGERTEYRRWLLTRTSYRFAGALSEITRNNPLWYFGKRRLIHVAKNTIAIYTVTKGYVLTNKVCCDLYFVNSIIFLESIIW